MVMKSTFRFVVSLAAWLAMITPAAAHQTAAATPNDLSSAPKATGVDEPSTAAPAPVNQSDGEPVHQRAARAWHSCRDDELSFGTAPQRDLGERRVHPDRSVADRLRAAEGLDGDRDGSRRRHGDQLRRRALPAQRQ